MKTLYTLALTTLGFLATNVYAAPVDGTTTISSGSGTYNGTIMIYDGVDNHCNVDSTNTLPIVVLSEEQFGDYATGVQSPMCNKCISFQDGPETVLARIIGLCEGCGDQNLGMYKNEISSLNIDGYDQFTHDYFVWSVVDCGQS
ncbi:hypothetical protein EV175_004440 [Coemansia sp. RSA 1933]|nr:hypothetical protein EV175_004440 [Coemansia sp. RSA 1933]